MLVVVISPKQCGNGTHAECGVWMSTVFRRETEAHAVSTRPAQLSSDVHVLVHLLENGTGKLVSVIAATTHTHINTRPFLQVLAGCLLKSPSPFIPELRILSGQA